MSALCPNGHTSEATDYCDTCGAPIGEQPPAVEPSAGPSVGEGPEVATGPMAAVQTCPNCSSAAAADALFCEECGYDFTTGAMPRGAGAPVVSGAPVGSGAQAVEPPTAGSGSSIPPPIEPVWVAEVWVDPAWYAEQSAQDPCPSPGLPAIVPLRVRSVLIGRVSVTRNIHPEIDLSSDSGVSRRHAQLTTDGSRWFVEDLQSSNGTYVGDASGPLPTTAIAVGPKTELEADDRIYVGAWTRIVIRKAEEGDV